MTPVTAEGMGPALRAANHGRSGFFIEEPFLRRGIPRIVQRLVNRPLLGAAFLDMSRPSDILTRRALEGFGQPAQDDGNLLHGVMYCVRAAIRPRRFGSAFDCFERADRNLARAVYTRLPVGSQQLGKITAGYLCNRVQRSRSSPASPRTSTIWNVIASFWESPRSLEGGKAK